MTRRNLSLLVLISVVSLICYQKANSANRARFSQMFGNMVEVMEKVDSKYVEKVNEEELFNDALEAMIAKLDPYSSYMAPDDYAEMQQAIDGKFGGIGIELSTDRDSKMLIVENPLVGTPAWERGVLAGDTIVKINGESTEGFTRNDAVHRLRGKVGTPVQLTVLHKGETELHDINLVRAEIHVDSVLGDSRASDGHWDFMLPGEDHLGYVRITTFGEDTVAELEAALASLAQSNVRGVIIDLRNNAGGLLTAANETCDLFLASGRIVSIKGRELANNRDYDASGDAPYPKLPLVVLVNRYSASASEIVAACLQDHHRAIIVGERSWGKGTVQSLFPLHHSRSVLKLTTANYWRPSNKNIHRSKSAKETDEWGVMPNPGFEIKLTDEQLGDWFKQRRQRDVMRSKGKGAVSVKDDSEKKDADKKDAEKKDGEQKDGEATTEADKPWVDVQLQKGIEALQQEIAKGTQVTAVKE
jgi:carboxyl-terminal processing protease